MATGSVNCATRINYNVGLMGHVDSGKTTLAKRLSTTSSTASFDKCPQSQERGITIDLGFSSFVTKDDEAERLVTIVDCPGHASLFRTVIGGANILDLIVLVVDINKGIQVQTAECLVLGEIICDRLLVVLNKIDSLQGDSDVLIEKAKKKITTVLSKTKFSGSPIFPLSAVEGTGVEKLVSRISELSRDIKRVETGSFVAAADHCFSLKGQGTILTGTVLSGRLKLNDVVEIPQLKITRKVKSMQCFRTPVTSAGQGDRIGMCLTQFDASQFERGVVGAPGVVQRFCVCVVSVNPVKYYKQSVLSKAFYHCTIGHDTVLAKATFFAAASDADFSLRHEFQYLEELAKEGGDRQFALLELEKPIFSRVDSVVIGSKLDIQVHHHGNQCRLAFSGHVRLGVGSATYKTDFLPQLLLFKTKQRQGHVERVVDQHSVICRGMFKKDSRIDLFRNLKVSLDSGQEGTIVGSFGTSGKIKVTFASPLKADLKPGADEMVTLKYKKYLFKDKKVIEQ